MALAEECLVQLDFYPRDLLGQLLYLNKRDFESDEMTQNPVQRKATAPAQKPFQASEVGTQSAIHEEA